ncbi:hypothetical protein EX022_02805 [Salmonella enterica]|nr:hypothetical protein [Salmonella enterica]EAT0282099.1 hypothetical protein [Salmonella enterica]
MATEESVSRPQKMKCWCVLCRHGMFLCFPWGAIRTRRDTLRFFCLCAVQVNATSQILRKNKIKT